MLIQHESEPGKTTYNGSESFKKGTLWVRGTLVRAANFSGLVNKLCSNKINKGRIKIISTLTHIIIYIMSDSWG